MEDFKGAYLARKNDLSALPKNQHHAIAVFHLGGIAVECRLKSLLLDYHRINRFDENSNLLHIVAMPTIIRSCGDLRQVRIAVVGDTRGLVQRHNHCFTLSLPYRE